MTELPNQLQLHPHSPDTLLPLLAAHLPYSLGVYGTLVSAPRGEHIVVWATFSPETVPIPRVFVSRSDASSSIGPGLEGAWTVIVPYAGSGSHQTRIYCSYEHPSSRSGRARGTRTSEMDLDAAVKPPHEPGAAAEGAGSDQAEDQDKDRKKGMDQARQQVLAVFRAYLTQVDPDFRIAGCVHSLWAPALEDMWVVEVGERRGYCGAWVRRAGNDKRSRGGDVEGREDAHGAAVSKGVEGDQAKMKQSNGALDGYEVRLGTGDDVESFIEHTDIKRPATYYTSRLPFSSVLAHRPPSSPSSPAHLESGSSSIGEGSAKVAAQVLTHADGTIGSLYTFPSYRRRGLGKELVRRHIASGRGVVPTSVQGRSNEGAEGGEGWAWTHIFHGNTGSEAVFRSLGFESMWDVAWVYRRG